MDDIYWLNADARKFLTRGYLLPGEEPEKRMKGIAAAAEKYLDIKGFKKKFLDYLHRGFYSLSSPISSHLVKFREDKSQTNDSSSQVDRNISVHRLLEYIFLPLSL